MRIVLSTVLITLCTACVPMEDMTKKINSSLQDLTNNPKNPQQETQTTRTSKSVSDVGLANILPPYDKKKSVNLQYPHVALTILKSPKNWATHGPAKTFEGCWTLKATVWDSAKKSKDVGPFDWCSPDEVKVWAGSRFNGLPTPSLEDHLHNNLTGIERTTGPKPPSSVFPTGRAWSDAIAKNSGTGSRFDNEVMYRSTAFGRMFLNLAYTMGANVADDENDMRVWIVNIPD
jgi:hypothetical protein